MAEFRMPHLGADMTSGKVLQWRKLPGDHVDRGEIIADVETDKADIEVESVVAGVVEKLLVYAGDEVPVGTVLALITEDDVSETPEPADGGLGTEQPEAEYGRHHASASTRSLADKLGVAIDIVAGTGPGGSVTREDVERTAEAGESDRPARMRAAMASAMARSKREIPHYFVSTEVDISPTFEWLDAENAGRDVSERLNTGVVFVKSVALALEEFPELNGFWRDGHAVPSEAIHVGVAMSLRQGGLVAPALLDANRRSLSDLMAGYRDVVARARAGTLKASEYMDPTVTVMSLGDLGVESVFGVIYPPQVALVGFGTPVERPWVVDGAVLARRIVTVSLSGDHRTSDAYCGARFLASVGHHLQHPAEL